MQPLGNRPSTSSSTTRPSEENQAFAPFDPVADYGRYVDGEPRADGVRNFLAARGIELPEGSDADGPDARTVIGLGSRKNELLLELLSVSGVQVYRGAVALVKTLRAQGTPLTVVSASENTQAALETGEIADLFDVRIDGHVVKERGLAGKPAPDSYLEAAKALGVRAVVVEAGRAGHFGLVIGVNRPMAHSPLVLGCLCLNAMLSSRLCHDLSKDSAPACWLSFPSSQR